VLRKTPPIPAGQSSKTDGLGFGLAIASMLAERNGGHLEYNQPWAGGLEASLIIGKNTNRINPDTKQVSGDHQA
jgi:K+-sensing histidine kinase KdpD